MQHVAMTLACWECSSVWLIKMWTCCRKTLWGNLVPNLLWFCVQNSFMRLGCSDCVKDTLFVLAWYYSIQSISHHIIWDIFFIFSIGLLGSIFSVHLVQIFCGLMDSTFIYHGVMKRDFSASTAVMFIISIVFSVSVFVDWIFSL